MKKSLIVLSILAGITGVAHAENTTVLYGSLGYSVGFEGKVNRNDKAGDNAKDAVKSLTKNNWDLRTNKARFGIKGNEDINENLSAIYHFEFDIDKKVIDTEKLTFEKIDANDTETLKENLKGLNSGVNKTGKAYLGLKGNFGEVTFGKQSAAYGSAVGFNDTFVELGAYDGRKLGNFNKGIKYKSPNTLYGFELTSTINVDGDDPRTKGVDFWEVAAVYKNNGIHAGVAYQNRLANKSKDIKSEEVIGTSIGYKNDAFQAGVGYAHEATVGNFYNIGAEAYTGPNTFRAGLAYADYKGGKTKDSWTGALGYQYNFSERTYSWVEGQYDYYKDKQQDDGYNVVVGIRHDF